MDEYSEVYNPDNYDCFEDMPEYEACWILDSFESKFPGMLNSSARYLLFTSIRDSLLARKKANFIV